ADGWRRYAAAVNALANVALPAKAKRCASACTFIHVAGVDRRGPAYVHRGRFGAKGSGGAGGVDVDRSMTDTLEGLHRQEARITAFYRSMDAGEDFIRLYQETPTATVTKAMVDRIPRYVSDLLRARC